MLLFVLHILSYDIWFYVTHMLLHTRPLYWIHKKHHEKPFPTYKDTYHDHILESPIQASGFLLPLLICAFDPYQTIPAILLINARGMLMHDPRGSFIMGDHHLLHHRLSHGNYGQYWLDYMFNTLIVSAQGCVLQDNTKTEESRVLAVSSPTTESYSVGVVLVQEAHPLLQQTESGHQSSVHTVESEKSIAIDSHSHHRECCEVCSAEDDSSLSTGFKKYPDDLSGIPAEQVPVCLPKVHED